MPSFCSTSGSSSTSAIERSDSRPLLTNGARFSRLTIELVSITKYVLSRTTCPGVTGRSPVTESSAAPIRQEIDRNWKATQAIAVNRPFSRSRLKPESRTERALATIRFVATTSRPCAG